MIDQPLCCLIHTAPYATSRGKEALDFILAASTLSDQVSVIFIGQGIWQLYKKQQPATIHQKSYTAGFAALPDFGVTQIYSDKGSMEELKVQPDQFFLQVTLLTPQQIQHHLSQQKGIFHF